MAFPNPRNAACYLKKLCGTFARKRGERVALTVRDVRCDPLGGGDVPRIRALMSSIFSPADMSAGTPSVIQMSVEVLPEAPRRECGAGASPMTLATLAASWPVTTRRIAGVATALRSCATPAGNHLTLAAMPASPTSAITETIRRLPIRFPIDWIDGADVNGVRQRRNYAPLSNLR